MSAWEWAEEGGTARSAIPVAASAASTVCSAPQSSLHLVVNGHGCIWFSAAQSRTWTTGDILQILMDNG